MRLKDKVALVTGGSRGIGKAIAESLAQEGASVAVNYVKNSARAKKVVEGIESRGGRAMGIMADVSDPKQARGLIQKVVEKYGRLDILVNNAGVIAAGTTLDTTDADWNKMIAVNLKGPFNCTREAAAIMVRQKHGKIIHVSSISGLGGAPQGELAYCCAKAALIAMTTVNAQDLGPYGINVNCIAPGWIHTDMTLGEAGDKFEEMKNLKSSMAAMRRVGEPRDIAAVALFLASDDSSFVTGQVIVADGGRKDFLSHA